MADLNFKPGTAFQRRQNSLCMAVRAESRDGAVHSGEHVARVRSHQGRAAFQSPSQNPPTHLGLEARKGRSKGVTTGMPLSRLATAAAPSIARLANR